MFRHLTAITLLLAATSLCTAAEQDDWYEIELIIFEHKSPPGRTAEVWTPDPGMPAVDEAVELAPPAGEAPDLLPDLHSEALPTAGIRLPYQRLDVSELGMDPLLNRLTVSGAYDPRLHIAWRQPANPEQPVRGVRVRSETQEPAPGLGLPPSALFIDTRAMRTPTPRTTSVDGVVSLQRSRFLHLNIDLLLTEAAAETGESGLFSIFTRRDDLPKVYRLQAQRRIRVNEVHYFDHPVIGVIAQVRPYVRPDPAP